MTLASHSWDRLAGRGLWLATLAWFLVPSVLVIREGLYGLPCFAALPALLLLLSASIAFSRGPDRPRVPAVLATTLSSAGLIWYLAAAPTPIESDDVWWWWCALGALLWHIGCAVLLLRGRGALPLVAISLILIIAGQVYRWVAIVPDDPWHPPAPSRASDRMLWIVTSNTRYERDREPWVDELKRRPTAVSALARELARCAAVWEAEPYPCRNLMHRDGLRVFSQLAPRQALMTLTQAAQRGPGVYRLHALDALLESGARPDTQHIMAALLLLPAAPKDELVSSERPQIAARVWAALDPAQRKTLLDAWRRAAWSSEQDRERFLAELKVQSESGRPTNANDPSAP